MERTRRDFVMQLGLGAVVGGLASACSLDRNGRELHAAGPGSSNPPRPAVAPARAVTIQRIGADPIRIPAPIRRSTAMHHDVTLEIQEHVAEIEPGVTFNYLTFGGQVPGPMIRVRQGDTVTLRLVNPAKSSNMHNVDLHAVYGPGGGSAATTVMPGQTQQIEFQARYPGAFIYHCAVSNLDFHISSGMFGMILVEPPEGLPGVDHEFYLGQHEVYTDHPAGTKGHHDFDFDALLREDPSYVLLNGGAHGLTADRWGAMHAKVGETARVYFVCGGPNLASHFHPIGNVWTRAWSNGALASTPDRYVQTMLVSPGSCGVFEMEFPVPGDVRVVDHALTRVVSKGMGGVISVSGAAQPAIFDAAAAAAAPRN